MNVDFRKVKPNTQGDIIESFTSIFTKVRIILWLYLTDFPENVSIGTYKVFCLLVFCSKVVTIVLFVFRYLCLNPNT